MSREGEDLGLGLDALLGRFLLGYHLLWSWGLGELQGQVLHIGPTHCKNCDETSVFRHRKPTLGPKLDSALFLGLVPLPLIHYLSI